MTAATEGTTRFIDPFVSISDHVIETNVICEDDLLKLAYGEAVAIVVRSYCDEKLCRSMSDKLLNGAELKEYVSVPYLHKWGYNSYEGLSDPSREEEYFSQATAAMREIRSAWAPNLSPMDRLRLDLQEAWPGGATIERVGGRKLFVGQARSFKAGGGIIPHQDFLPWELLNLKGVAPSDATIPNLSGQLTANIYLQTATSGGELDLWTFGYEAAAYNERRAAGRFEYGLREDTIPASSLSLSPEAGMLIIFHASRLHRVRETRGADRLAMSTFIGVYDTESPLTYWS